MSDILAKITAYKLNEIAAAKAVLSLAEVEEAAKAADAPRGFLRALEAKRCWKSNFNCRDKKGVAVERSYSKRLQPTFDCTPD